MVEQLQTERGKGDLISEVKEDIVLGFLYCCVCISSLGTKNQFQARAGEDAKSPGGTPPLPTPLTPVPGHPLLLLQFLVQFLDSPAPRSGDVSLATARSQVPQFSFVTLHDHS